MLKSVLFLGAMSAVALAAAGSSQPSKVPMRANVDMQRMLAAGSDPDNWIAHGRTYEEQRFSPLDQVNDSNVAKLGLAFSVDLDTNRGQEATPIAVDGVLYFSTAWSKVYAVDATSGQQLWVFDPHINPAKAVHACCDVVNRGVAVYEGKVFIGTIDGRLIAIDATTGKEAWSTLTVDPTKPYTITGAPRVFKGKIIIGNSGADLGVRGYVTAYATSTGRKIWRFYTVPGNPTDGPDGEASDQVLASLARPTWFGKWWELGGGGTVWDSIVYDPELDQLLIGVGNGSPWNQRVRSEGRGDNLFLTSIVALNPDTGKYKWHYQVNPGETWDYTAVQQMTLADLKIGGRVRKVVMQAPKNGFFYVIDRRNGRLISAEPFVPQNWAERIDIKSGRPVERPGMRYQNGPVLLYPSGIGAHAWMPMSYSPKTGLVYIPAMHAPFAIGGDDNFTRHPGRWNTGIFGAAPPPGTEEEARFRGWLVAWDPVRQREAWRIERDWPWNGGTLATGGNLVFQGDAHGHFRAYRATNGEELWSFNAGRGVMAGPISYRVDGIQYIAVLAGYGGSMGMGVESAWMQTPPPNGKLLVFRIDGRAEWKTPSQKPALPFVTSDEKFTDAQLVEGMRWYGQFCAICHAGPTLPDLYRSPIARSSQAWRAVVIDGALESRGMANFRDYLTPDQSEAIRAAMSQEGRRRQEAAGAKPVAH